MDSEDFSNNGNGVSDLDFDTSVLDSAGGEDIFAPGAEETAADPFAGIDSSLFDEPTAEPEQTSEDNFDLPDLGDADLGTLNDLGHTAGLDDLSPVSETEENDDFSTAVPDGLFDSADMELPEENTEDALDSEAEAAVEADGFSTDGLDDLGSLDDYE